MNIASITSPSIPDSGRMQQVGIAMLSKQIDTAESTGANLVASLNALPAPSVASMTGVGQNIDLQA